MLIFAGMAELADAYGSGPYESDFMQVRPLLPAPNENRNFDTKLRFCFFPENTVPTGFFQKEKFQSNGWFAEIRAFSAIAHKFCSLRNFSLKNKCTDFDCFLG